MPRIVRQHQRTSVALDVVLDLAGARVRGRSRNVSLGGMFVETTDRVPRGARVTLDVRVPDIAGPVVIEATVRWTSADGVGLQFGALRTSAVWALNQVLREDATGRA